MVYLVFDLSKIRAEDDPFPSNLTIGLTLLMPLAPSSLFYALEANIDVLTSEDARLSFFF